MTRHLLKLLASALALLASPVVHAAITCSIASGGFATAYDPASAVNNVTQSQFTVTCTRGLASDPSSVNYAVTVDNGVYANGINNRAAYLANRIRYDVFKDSSCSTKWKGSTAINGTINFVGTGTVTQQSNYWGCVLPGQTGLTAGTYTDQVTATMTYGPTPSLVALTAFGVSISTPATCSLSAAPGNIVFNYISLGAAVAAGTTYGVTCTNWLPYSMALDTTIGTVVGINYTLALSAANSVGTGAQQTFSINGTVAAGQAGTCAASGCSGSRTHSLTITY
jgi:spore coat protein U-like protein